MIEDLVCTSDGLEMENLKDMVDSDHEDMAPKKLTKAHITAPSTQISFSDDLKGKDKNSILFKPGEHGRKILKMTNIKIYLRQVTPLTLSF